jgi:hypothetical protein
MEAERDYNRTRNTNAEELAQLAESKWKYVIENQQEHPSGFRSVVIPTER